MFIRFKGVTPYFLTATPNDKVIKKEIKRLINS